MSYGIVILRGPFREEQLILTHRYGEAMAFSKLDEAKAVANLLRSAPEMDILAVPLPAMREPPRAESLLGDPVVRARRARWEVMATVQLTRKMIARSRALVGHSF
jgi:hypothetical protein